MGGKRKKEKRIEGNILCFILVFLRLIRLKNITKPGMNFNIFGGGGEFAIIHKYPMLGDAKCLP